MHLHLEYSDMRVKSLSGDDFYEAVLASKSEQVVLRIKVLEFRSGDLEMPILIFEGKSDAPPYGAWIKRINEDFQYGFLIAEGKGQLLEFCKEVNDGKSTDLESVYFIADKDFDSLRGYKSYDNLFLTQMYSFENYLVSNEVFTSILRDDFLCNVSPSEINRIIALFNEMLNKFCESMVCANFRIYVSKLGKIRRKSINERVGKYVSIELCCVEEIADMYSLKNLVSLEREPTDDEYEEHYPSFLDIENPGANFRGKYILSFFLSWLELLSEARKKGEHPFSTSEKISFNRSMLDNRNLASRSQIPEGLKDFILSISH